MKANLISIGQNKINTVIRVSDNVELRNAQIIEELQRYLPTRNIVLEDTNDGSFAVMANGTNVGRVEIWNS